MKLLALSERDVTRALPMPDAVEAMKEAFADLSSGRGKVPPRAVLDLAPTHGVFLVKPAIQPGKAFGAKLLSYLPGNPAQGRPLIQALVVLFDPTTGAPAAICEGAHLTAWRTGAASGAASDLLARSDAHRLSVFGAGVQAATQILAVDAVRELSRVTVYARNRARLAKFVEEMNARIEADVVASESPTQAVREADIVCTATIATTPVLNGAKVEPGTHLNAVGSFTATTRELDAELVRRATVYVDSRESARSEAGELILAREAGATRENGWAELGEVVLGTREGRSTDEQITLFKSVGVAIQDTAAASLALERARELGLGTEITL